MKPFVQFCFLLLSIIMFGQEFNGTAYYQSKTTLPQNNRFENREISDQMKKNIEAHLKKMLNKTYVLHFNKEESLYKKEEQLDAPGNNSNRVIMMPGISNVGPQYKNIAEKSYLQEQDLFGKRFLIADSLPSLNWKLEDESKQIGKYVAFKAKTTMMVDTVEGTQQRHDNNDESQTKEVEVTAWYTPQIPISQGPDEYWGLPGLILEVQTDRTSILCTEIVMNPQESKTIKKPTKGKKITRKEYQKIAQEKMKEMQEMRGRRNGNGIRVTPRERN